jgi:hypothetical protein
LVLDELTRQFIEHKFDLKWLIGELVRSETYQMAGRGAVKEALPKHFERARIGHSPPRKCERRSRRPAATRS